MSYLNNPFNRQVMNLQKMVGAYTGILSNPIVYKTGTSSGSLLNIVNGNLPQYTKITVNPTSHINYHLSGYGFNFKESLAKFEGEALERYATVIAHEYKKDDILISSYSKLIKQKKHVVDLSLINLFDNKQLQTLHEYAGFRDTPLKRDDIISWTRTNSIFDPNCKIFIPTSMFFIGFQEKNNFFTAFSTGTASHESFNVAFLNAIIEYIQIDAFITSWYSNDSLQMIDYDSFPEQTKIKINYLLGENRNKYNIYFIDFSKYSVDLIPVIGTFLVAKDNLTVPAISFGLQGGMEINRVIIRSLSESIANLEMSAFNYLMDKTYIDQREDSMILDVDNNVKFFASPYNMEKNLNYLNSRFSKKRIRYETLKAENKLNSTLLDGKSSIEGSLRWLIHSLYKNSKYACFMDITPPFITPKDMRVVKVFIPELQAMCLPSEPFKKHPRFKGDKNGSNFYIHPLP